MPGPMSLSTLLRSQISTVSNTVDTLAVDAAEIIVNDPYAWGTGADGNISLDGITTVTIGGVSHAPSGSTYTLTRPLNARVLTISNGVALNSSGFLVHCWELAGTGTIKDRGANASGGTAGMGLTASGTTQRTSGNGGAGVSSPGAGQAGSAITSALGGGGMSGGTAGANPGGGGGSPTVPTAAVGFPSSSISTWAFLKGVNGTAYAGGSGGGSGAIAVGASGTSGGGGGGGGVIGVFARKSVSTITINVGGGNGGNGTSSSGQVGGGGGGGGGYVLCVYKDGAAPTITVGGGTAGSAAGGASAASNGSSGSSTVIQMS